MKQCTKGCLYNGVKRYGTYYRITFGGYHLDDIPVLLPRKKVPKLSHQKQKNPSHYQFKLTKEKENSNYYGFEIEGDKKRYMLADFSVTH